MSCPIFCRKKRLKCILVCCFEKHNIREAEVCVARRIQTKQERAIRELTVVLHYKQGSLLGLQ